MATQKLENGADVRFVEMPGDSSLEATHVYTHVSIRKLKEIHASTHPAASATLKAGGHADEGGAREALLPSLAAQGDEEEVAEG